MKVYIITSGDYSDYHIDSVFTDKTTAESVCAFLNDSNKTYGEYNVEEFEADYIKAETSKEPVRLFDMGVHIASGDISHFRENSLTFDSIGEIGHNDGYIQMKITLPKDTNKQEAKKIMLDRIAQYKAEMAGVV